MWLVNCIVVYHFVFLGCHFLCVSHLVPNVKTFAKAPDIIIRSRKKLNYTKCHASDKTDDSIVNAKEKTIPSIKHNVCNDRERILIQCQKTGYKYRN